jgi:hypothetical protein
MKPQPITKQRSPWQEVPVPDRIRAVNPEAHGLALWERRVSDGLLVALVCQEPLGVGRRLEWHLSISFRNHRGDLSRYPSWDEMAHARYELLPGDLEFVMFLPPVGDYVALHDTTFHLHEYPQRDGEA